MIIDVHNHLGFRYDLGIDDVGMLRMMDRAGVDMAVCFSQPVTWDNDYVLQKAKEHPDRFIPFAGINPWRGTAARDELRHCFERGARGLKLHPVRDAFSLAEKALVNPIFELCDEWRVPIICHGMDDWTNTPWQFSEMAGRFPGVTLIMAHGGHNFLREDAITILKDKRQPNLYVDTSVMYGSFVRRYVDEVSPDRVIMGTDTPAEAFEVEMKKIETWIENKSHRALIMGGNIARILGLKA